MARRNFFQTIPLNHQEVSARTLDQAIEANRGQLGYQAVLEVTSRPNAREGELNREDWRTLLNPQEGYSREEWASHLRKEGYLEAAHAYELGATATASTVIIPVEEHAHTTDNNEMRRTSFAYLDQHLPTREMAREFHDSIQVIWGQDPSSEAKTAITTDYLNRINFQEDGGRRSEADRLTAARETIEEMKSLATEIRAIDPNFNPQTEDIMSRHAGSGDAEHVLERISQTDQEIERIENDIERDEEVEATLFNPLFERTTPEDEQTAISESIELADTIEIDPDLDRTGTVFSVSSIRVTGLDNTAQLPYDNQIVTPTFIVGEVLPRVNEELRQGTSPETIARDARELSYLVSSHLDRREEIAAKAVNPAFAAALTQAQNTETREGVQQVVQSLSESPLSPSERLLVLQSQSFTHPLSNQFTEAVGQLAQSEYRNNQEEALSRAMLYVTDRNAVAERTDASPREQGLPLSQLNEWKATQTQATQAFTDRAVEFMERQTSGNLLTPFNQAAEQISSAKTTAETVRVASAIATSDQLTHDEKRILLLPGAHTAHQTQQQEYALSNVVRDYNASATTPIRFDNVRAEQGQVERETLLRDTGHLQTINDALTGKRIEGETRTLYAISATPSEIKGEYRAMADFVEKYTETALREDAYLRNSNESKFFRLAHEELTRAKDEARVEKVSNRILQANTQLALNEREGKLSDPDMHKLTREQRALLSLPGPHTQHYSEGMVSTLRETLMPPQERYAAGQNLLENPERQSPQLRALTNYLSMQTDKEGHPSDKRIARMITVMKTDPSLLNTPPSATEQKHDLRGNFESLNLVERDALHKQITMARAEALVHTPERASQRAQEAFTQITSSRDTATLHTRLETALSRQEGQRDLPSHEALYLKNAAKQTELSMDRVRDEGQRKFGEPPVRSESYRNFIEEMQGLHKAADAPGVRVVTGAEVTVRDQQTVTERVVRTLGDRAVDVLTEKYQISPSEKGDQVIAQADTLKQLQRDTLAARDAYQNHNERIIERVAGEEAGRNAHNARFESWSQTWVSAMKDNSSPEALAVRNELQANKQMLGQTINEHVKEGIAQPEFERRIAGLSENTRDFLAGAARESEMAGDIARLNTMELTKDAGFREQALQQATPVEREYQTAYRNSLESTAERFYAGFEKMDSLVAQAEGRERDLERPEPERERDERNEKSSTDRDDKTSEVERTNTDGPNAVTDVHQWDYDLDR